MTGESNILINIENACEFCVRKLSHDELRTVLQGKNDSLKQLCLLQFDDIEGQEDANLLLFHLTEHHGTLRESAATKINEIILNGKYVSLFQKKYAIETFVKAVNDVNPNICRLIIEILPFIDDRETFLNLIYERVDFVWDEIQRLRRTHLYTKKVFNLYWCLEALNAVKAPLDARLESLLLKTHVFKEYTIREKAAMVVCGLSETSAVLEEIKGTLRSDSNFYVKRYVKMF